MNDDPVTQIWTGFCILISAIDWPLVQPQQIFDMMGFTLVPPTAAQHHTHIYIYLYMLYVCVCNKPYLTHGVTIITLVPQTQAQLVRKMFILLLPSIQTPPTSLHRHSSYSTIILQWDKLIQTCHSVQLTRDDATHRCDTFHIKWCIPYPLSLCALRKRQHNSVFIYNSQCSVIVIS